MKKALLIGIFSLLVLAPSYSALAQDGSSTPAVKTAEKSSPAIPHTNGQRKLQEAAEAAAGNATAANQPSSPPPADLTKAMSNVLPAGSEEAQKNYNAGVALYESGKLDEAIRAFTQADKLSPDDPQTHYMMGMVYWKSKNFNASVDSFKRTVRLKPDWAEAYFRLGLAYYVLGRKIQSNEAYKRLLELKSPLANKLYRINNAADATNVSESSKPELASSSAKQVDAVPVSASPDTKSNIGENLKVGPTPSTTKQVESGLVSDPVAVAPTNEKPGAPASESNSLSTTPASSNEAVPAAAALNTKPSPTVSESNHAPLTTVSDSGPVPITRIATAEAAVSNKPIATGSSGPTEIYKVGVGDVLDIRLLNSASNRSTLYTVIEGGFIDFPIAGGPIPVAGLTIKDIQTRITSELKRLAVEERTQVAVGVRQYASHTVIITGLVSSPGTKILRREGVPLYVLLAEVQPRLDAARATIMRAGSPSQVVDLSDSAALNFIVRPADVINITSRPQEFYYIGGRITYPGQKVFQPGMTLVQAILAAGGLARDNLVELSREGSNGRLTTTKFNIKEIKSGKIQDPKLQPGDRIEVFH